MRKLKFFNICFLFLLFSFSCKQEKETDDATLSFDKANIISKGHILYDTPGNGWRLHEGNAKTDRTELYRNKASLVVSSDILTCKSQVAFSLNTQEVEMNEVIFSGKYKVESMNKTEGTLLFSISRLNEVKKLTKDSIIIRLTPQDTLWSDFHIASLVDKDDSEFIYFEIGALNSTHFRISDCKATVGNQSLAQIINTKYGAEKDKEFGESSHIDLGEELTPQKVENLEILGKVWGFLKYYHPEVIKGKYNWDYELFRVLPEIANAEDAKERSRLLNKWIDKYGKIKEITDYTISDSTQYSRIINLDWINNRELFDERLISKFNKIKNAKRSNKFNYYVVPYKKTFNDGVFIREKAYENIRWNDQGFRLLTLFRLWNVIEYCFPYTDYTDVPWNTLLKTFIPGFFHPEGKAEYELSIKKLAACINDSHGYVHIPNNRLGETIIAPIYKNKVPVELIQTKEGCIVVKSTETYGLERGDVILSIDGKEIKDIIEDIHPYIIASNENGFIRNILPYLLSTDKSDLKVTILRNENIRNLNINDFSRTRQKQSIKSWEDYKLAKKHIIHVDNIKSAETNKETVEKKMNSKGLIIDMRRYPYDNNLKYMSNILFPVVSYPLWLSGNQICFPGNYKLWHYQETKENTDYYKGKVAILVDENTQSAGETFSMWFSYIPQNVTIGSQTAGANGNISLTYPLPCNILFTYSGLGAYYPNGEILQRKGVKIDITARPTRQEIKEGRDVCMEKAIEYIVK